MSKAKGRPHSCYATQAALWLVRNGCLLDEAATGSGLDISGVSRLLKREGLNVRWRTLAAHGTHSAYARHLRNGETPCDDCKVANARYHKAEIARRRARLLADPSLVEHGKYTTYSNWGCRCDDCKAAKSIKNAERYSGGAA